MSAATQLLAVENAGVCYSDCYSVWDDGCSLIATVCLAWLANVTFLPSHGPPANRGQKVTHIGQE